MAVRYPLTHGNGGGSESHIRTQKNPFGPLILMEDRKCAHCLMALIKVY